MEAAIQTVVKVFLKSSKGKESLGGKDFQSLVKSQLGNILTNADSSEAVKEMRQGLDSNHDGKVSFEEYMELIGYLANTLSQQRSLSDEKPVEAVAEDAPNQEKKEETAEVKVEAVAAAEVEPKAEPEVVEETQPEAPKEVKEEEPPAAAAEEEEVKEEVKVEEAEKVEEDAAGEKPVADAEEAGEKKSEEEETS